MRRKPSPWPIALALPALIVVLSISGCQLIDGGSPADPPSASLDASTTPSATPAPSDVPGDSAVPVSVSCDLLLSPQEIYDFNPNFGLVPAFKPAAGTVAAHALELGGTACQWLNQTSGETIEAALARPASAEFAALLSESRAGTLMPDVGDEAYFSVSEQGGTAQAFAGGFWVSVSSTYFSVPDDARSLLTDAVVAAR